MVDVITTYFITCIYSDVYNIPYEKCLNNNIDKKTFNRDDPSESIRNLTTLTTTVGNAYPGMNVYKLKRNVTQQKT